MNTENQEQNTVNEQETKTFTEDQVNEIVEKRLGRERAKYANFDELKDKAAQYDEMQEKNKSELERANEKVSALQKKLDDMAKENEIRNIRQSVSKETGVPDELLSGTNEDECKMQADKILAFAKSKQGYPTIKDGGETPQKKMSKQDILAIKNQKERLKAIQENIDLFK